MVARHLGTALIAGALALAGSAALAQGDAAQGEKVFNQCKACHAVDEPQNKVGPHLVGIFGRPAGSVEDFKYSDALKESGITWNEETLSAFLADPRGYIKGNRMAYAGLKKDEDIANLLAYLKQESAS
jgi:cytochrome c